MDKEKARQSTSQILRRKILQGISLLNLAVAIALALALLTYWLGVWGKDILKVEIAVEEGLLFLLVTLAITGVLLYCLSRQVQSPADYRLRIQGGKALRGTEELQLTPQEFRLLEYLMREEKSICEYTDILEQIWQNEVISSGPPDPSDLDRLTTLVLRLRKKITTIPHDYIRNHTGRGYEFVQWENGPEN
jgi:DNA-binding winged helix-turn-helix (wHTH) protein